MATDFFERQSAARRSTKWLVVMFSLGVVGLVGGTVLIAAAAVAQVEFYQDAIGQDAVASERIAIPALAGLAALMLILLGSWYKISQLSGGGTVVAERLGGRRVYPNTTDPIERRLLNVVEEMALASGVPVPPVYLLAEEQGVNAFAAGYSPSDAVVAVTRGTAEQLSRDELQGVVAHEFSHVLNGDMRLNIRLIGVLHGILLLGLIGRVVLRGAAGSGRSRSGRDGGGAYLLAIGLAMVVLGYLGTLMGSLIKAAVSRQREYLADASAVQFTRNPSGLAGALKRIGSLVMGSKLQAVNASEASHMLFATGVWEGFTSLTATHPPLRKRILAIDPNWDGKFPAANATPAGIAETSGAVSGLVGDVGPHAEISAGVPVNVVQQSANQVGEPIEAHRVYAAELIHELPPEIAEAVHEPFGARAVIFALLLDRDREIQEQQLAVLRAEADAAVYELTLKLILPVQELDVRARLPLVDMSLPALRAMSPSQYGRFSACFAELVGADQRIGLFEWSLHRILMRHLRPQYEKTASPRVAYYGLQRMGSACSTLLSTLAHADNQRDEAPAAFARGKECLPGVAVELLDPQDCGLGPLSRALDELARVAVKQRRKVVEACAACICADRDVSVAEAELYRGICDMLDCPMPPLLPGQNVA